MSEIFKNTNTSKDVLITDFGLVSPLGSTAGEFETNMFNGKSGVRSLHGSHYGTVVSEDFPVPYAAFIQRDELPSTHFFKEPQAALKSWLMSASATESLLSKLSPDLKIDAIVYGTADGVSFEQVVDVLQQKKATNFLTQDYNLDKTRCESSVEVIHEILKSQGFAEVAPENRICINSACATGNNAIGIAFEGIRSGRWKRCLVGGVDARCEPSNYLNFNSLGALTTAPVPPEKASRPFSKDRSGFVRGEGAAVLLIESREAAEERKAPKVCARVAGYGFTSDAYRLTDGRDDGASTIQAMKTAIQSAGLQPEQIDYINAHGTSTPLNDRLETFAIKQVFGEKAYKIPVSSLKSQIGHSTIASSALEGIACCLMLQAQKVAPTLNFNGGDPDCDLDYVPDVSRDHKMKYVLSNSFGFGGQNACVVFAHENKI